MYPDHGWATVDNTGIQRPIYKPSAPRRDFTPWGIIGTNLCMTLWSIRYEPNMVSDEFHLTGIVLPWAPCVHDDKVQLPNFVAVDSLGGLLQWQEAERLAPSGNSSGKAYC